MIATTKSLRNFCCARRAERGDASKERADVPPKAGLLFVTGSPQKPPTPPYKTTSGTGGFDELGRFDGHAGGDDVDGDDGGRLDAFLLHFDARDREGFGGRLGKK